MSLAAWALAALLSSPAAARPARYEEPGSGPRLIIDNRMTRKRLINVDKYCLRELSIDGVRVFGGNACKLRHGQRHAVRVTPGRHKLVFDMMSEWGEGDPDVPSRSVAFVAEAGGEDFVVLLKDAEPPAQLSPEQAAAAAGPAAAPAPCSPESDPLKLLERLKELHDKGVLSAEEFSAKKAELLKRL